MDDLPDFGRELHPWERRKLELPAGARTILLVDGPRNEVMAILIEWPDGSHTSEPYDPPVPVAGWNEDGTAIAVAARPHLTQA